MSKKALKTMQELFFFTFPKKWVGRAMGNEALNWDGLYTIEKAEILSLSQKVLPSTGNGSGPWHFARSLTKRSCVTVAKSDK